MLVKEKNMGLEYNLLSFTLFCCRLMKESRVFAVNTSVGLLREAQAITAGLGGFATICERRLFGSTGLYNSTGYGLHLGSMCGHDLGSMAF